MADMTAEQAHALLHNFFLGTMKNESRTTKTILEAVPADKGDFKPDPVVKSAIELAWHIVGAEHRFVDAVIQGAFDFTNTGRPAAHAYQSSAASLPDRENPAAT